MPASTASADSSASFDPARVHPTAIVDEGVKLGRGARIWHWVHVCAGASIGAGASLGQNVYVGPGVRIGAGCKIQNNVSVYDGVTLAEGVFVGPSAVFTNVINPRAHVNRKSAFLPTSVERHATIGANATIVCGTTLGEGCFVAAGATVTGDVQPRVLVQGCPARAVGWRCDCGEALARGAPGAPLECEHCQSRYADRADGGLDLLES